MTRQYVTFLIYGCIWGIVFVALQIWLFVNLPFRRIKKRKGKSGAFENLKSAFITLLFLGLLPLTSCIVIRGIYITVWSFQEDGYITEMRLPASQSLIDNLCEWGWLEHLPDGCQSQPMTYAQVIGVFRHNIQNIPVDDVKERLSEYSFRCDDRGWGEMCGGRIEEIAYSLRIEGDSMQFEESFGVYFP